MLQSLFPFPSPDHASQGEVVARLIFHATMDDKTASLAVVNRTLPDREEVLQTLYRMMDQS